MPEANIRYKYIKASELFSRIENGCGSVMTVFVYDLQIKSMPLNICFGGFNLNQVSGHFTVSRKFLDRIDVDDRCFFVIYVSLYNYALRRNI